MQDKLIGFIGLGNMGTAMARHLVRGGFEVLAYDIDAEKRAAFAEETGMRNPATVAELAEATVLLTMLPNGAIVRKVLDEGGAAGLLGQMQPGTLMIDTTSSPPEATRELATALKARGCHLVDAPVSGARAGAEAADLVFMIGCDDDAVLERARTVLSCLGNRLFHLGPVGAGHAMKALNNYVSAAGYVAAAEAMIIGTEVGLDPAQIVDVLNVSTGRNFSTEVSMPRILREDFERRFTLELYTKDVRIAANLGDSAGVTAPLTHLVHDRFAAARDAVGPDLDHTEAYEYWARKPEADA